MMTARIKIIDLPRDERLLGDDEGAAGQGD
jgi:hypothetical protein